jgi:DNA-binding MarR family transcriptional regulator
MANTRSAELAELFCFDLYAASRAVTALYRPLLADLGLTYPQYLVMVVLWRERSRTIKQLGEALQLDYGTLTPLLRRLAANGLITRERRADDERSVLVRLTPAGTALRRRAQRIPRIVQCASGLDTDRIATLQATLRELTASVSGAAAAD